MPNTPNMPQLEKLRRDLCVAALCIEAFGELTEAARAGITHWFEDVEVSKIFPLPALELTDEERSTLIKTVIDEMLAAVTDCSDESLDDKKAFECLGPVLDPLYKEFHSLHAALYNELWEAHRPKSHDEREMRIHLLETLTGLDRGELLERAPGDQDLLAMISRAGITMSDLENHA
jgi:hypothetical protein